MKKSIRPQPAFARASGTPYNVINSARLNERLSEIAQGIKRNSIINNINNVRNMIQQVIIKKVSSGFNGKSYQYWNKTVEFKNVKVHQEMIL